MSQPKKKKVVVTTGNKTSSTASGKSKAKPKTKAKVKASTKPKKSSLATEELIFGKQHYILMGIGVLAIILGLALMSGGAMDSPDEWDPDRIYSFRRTVLAPFLILAGLGIEIFAIFRR